jgi:putative oxidoreductase
MSKLSLSALDRHRDLGLLLMRVGIGLMFFFVHGLPKLRGGTELWTQIGSALGRLGIDFAHQWFGLAATLAETACALLIVVGFLTRWACVPLVITLAVASFTHLDKGDGLPIASHAIEMAIFFAGLFFVGPGRHSVDARLP